MPNGDGQVVEFLPTAFLNLVGEHLHSAHRVAPHIREAMPLGNQEVDGCKDKLGEGVSGSLFPCFSCSFCN